MTCRRLLLAGEVVVAVGPAVERRAVAVAVVSCSASIPAPMLLPQHQRQQSSR